MARQRKEAPATQPKRLPQHGAGDTHDTEECICWDAAGFEEALPMDVWEELMDRRARCPIHGSE